MRSAEHEVPDDGMAVAAEAVEHVEDIVPLEGEGECPYFISPDGVVNRQIDDQCEPHKVKRQGEAAILRAAPIDETVRVQNTGLESIDYGATGSMSKIVKRATAKPKSAQ
jgi:hypothetical protein